jgi:hypothetical protein
MVMVGSGIMNAGFDMEVGSKLRHPSSPTPRDCDKVCFTRHDIEISTLIKDAL